MARTRYYRIVHHLSVDAAPCLGLRSRALGSASANWFSPKLVFFAALLLVLGFFLGTGPALADPPAPTEAPSPVPSLVPFPQGVPAPLPVNVGLKVNGISKINEAANTYQGDFDLRLRWQDPRLAFDAKEMGTDRREFGNEAAIAELATIWNPQVTITNMRDQEAHVAPGLFIYADGHVDYIQRVGATMDTRFALAAFPFDTQELPVILLSSKYTLNQIALVQEQADLDASGLKEGLKVRGWNLKEMSFKAGRVRAWNGDFVPQLTAAVTMKRIPTPHLGVIITPFLLTLLIPTILTLYAKVDPAPRLTAWGGSILALVALNFTFTVRFPALDNDSLVSQLVATGFAYQLTMVVLTMTLLNPPVAEKVMSKFMHAEWLAFTRWSIPLVFLGTLATESVLKAFAW